MTERPSGRVMIAGTNSGCGKTTVTCAVLAALVALGKKVVSFKCGPDYIDPMFHKKATGVESRNLDIFLMGEQGVVDSVARHTAGSEIAVMEGVMGLYDGQDTTSSASSNHVSLITRTPVLLVADVRGSALSICAAIQGFLGFEENNIQAVILNNTSATSLTFYRQMIEGRLDTEVIGCLPPVPAAHIASRHLGLVTADEIADIRGKIKLLAEQALASIDFDALTRIAAKAEALTGGQGASDQGVDKQEQGSSDGDGVALGKHRSMPKPRHCGPDPQSFALPVGAKTDRPAPQPGAAASPQVTLGVASDEAFSFFYEDNHDLFKALGAELHFFSPLHDSVLSGQLDGLVLWGGYPELYAQQLAANSSMLRSIRAAIATGLPVYAECGGFMYLQQSLTDLGGECHQMLGVLPGKVTMTKGLQNFGYHQIEARVDNMLCKTGDKINAHFFHHSTSDCEGEGFVARRRRGADHFCIVADGNIFAGYQHLHFFGNPDFARNFIDACSEHKRKQRASHGDHEPSGD
ncbi:MAG: cobyrinate a,c-diamide synthase [Actinomycetia bacterium]|nr:cobyrinate a,c-diamide synthase [Actinomycetes bacterium]